MRVRWTGPALRDLEAIGEYVARNNSAAVAARIVTAILDQAEALAAFPHIGRPGRISGTRELVIVDTPFIAPYRVREATVEILAVFHGSRQWPDALN
ncbi:MAG: type II toxin-antitoxin system RelE/ParE family toxin [Methylocella sp.]